MVRRLMARPTPPSLDLPLRFHCRFLTFRCLFNAVPGPFTAFPLLSGAADGGGMDMDDVLALIDGV